MVVLQIGTNNLEAGLGLSSATPRNSPMQIAEGVFAIIGTVRLRWPNVRFILHGLFPRGSVNATIREEILLVNSLLSTFCSQEGGITYLDMTSTLLHADGTLSNAYRDDHLHLSVAGYEVWADFLRIPLIAQLG